MAKLRKCPGCGRLADPDLKTCPRCGKFIGSRFSTGKVNEESIEEPKAGEIDQSMMSRKSTGPARKPSVADDITVGLMGAMSGRGRREKRRKAESARSSQDPSGPEDVPGRLGMRMPAAPARNELGFFGMVFRIVLWLVFAFLCYGFIRGFGTLSGWVSLAGMAITLPLGFMDGFRAFFGMTGFRRCFWIFVLVCVSVLTSADRMGGGSGFPVNLPDVGRAVSDRNDADDGQAGSDAARVPDGATVKSLTDAGYNLISLETMYEFAWCMEGEKAVTVIEIRDKLPAQCGAKAGNDGSDAASSVTFRFADSAMLKDYSDGDRVTVAGTVVPPEGKGRPFVLIGCSILGPAELAGSLEYDPDLGEALVEKDRLKNRVALSYTPVNEFRYVLDDADGTVTLTEYTGSSGRILLSPVYEIAGKDYAVRGIAAKCFLGCQAASGIESICIPEGVVGISTQAFAGLTGLRSLYLPVSLMPELTGDFSGSFPYANMHYDWQADLSGAGPRDTSSYYKRVDEGDGSSETGLDAGTGGKNGFDLLGDLLGTVGGALTGQSGGEPVFYTEIFYAGSAEQWSLLGVGIS